MVQSSPRPARWQSPKGPAGEGNQITTYDYDAAGLVNLVNGPLAASDTTTYVNDARSGKPSTVTAPNAQLTTVAYDGLGRTTGVTLPGATAVSLMFDYRLGSGPPRVRTSEHRGAGNYNDRWVFLDGLGREIQTQQHYQEAATISVVSSAYDAVGRPKWVTRPYSLSVPPDTYRTYAVASLPRSSFAYDADGLTQQTQHGSSGSPTVSSTRTQGWRTRRQSRWTQHLC